MEGDGKVLVFVPVDLRDDDSWFEVTVVSVSTWCKVMSVLRLGSQLLQHMIIHCSFIEPSILHAFHNSKQMPVIRDVQYRFAFVSCPEGTSDVLVSTISSGRAFEVLSCN